MASMAQKRMCRMGSIGAAITGVKRVIKGMTNFKKITQSPEALAEFISDIWTDGYFNLDQMTYEQRLAWLKQESK